MRVPPAKKRATTTAPPRQFVPEGYIDLLPLRLFRVTRPTGLSDELVEGTFVAIEPEGVLRVFEMVYVKNPQGTEGERDEWTQMALTRRLFRVWLDCEEIVGGLPVVSKTVN